LRHDGTLVIEIRGGRTNCTDTARLWRGVGSRRRGLQVCLVGGDYQRIRRPDARLLLDGLTLVAIIICGCTGGIWGHIWLCSAGGELARELLLYIRRWSRFVGGREGRRRHSTVVLAGKLRKARRCHIGGKLSAGGTRWHIGISGVCAPALTAVLAIQLVIDRTAAFSLFTLTVTVATLRSVAVAATRALALSITVSAFGGALDDAIGGIVGLWFGGYEGSDRITSGAWSTAAPRGRGLIDNQVTQAAITVVTP
jgi:hypothetical protein